MKRFAMALLVLATLSGGAFAQTQSVGIVLMYGKQGSSNQNIDGLAGSLTGAGYLIGAPKCAGRTVASTTGRCPIAWPRSTQRSRA